jgi:hypothetical protein
MTKAVRELIKEAKELDVGAELISALEELGKDAKGSRSEFKELREIVDSAKMQVKDEPMEEYIEETPEETPEEIPEETEEETETSIVEYINNRANPFAIAEYTFRDKEFSIDIAKLNETDKKRLARAVELKIITKV